MIYYLLINMLVTACTMVAILYAWETYRPRPNSETADVLPAEAPTLSAAPERTDQAEETAAEEEIVVPEMSAYTVQVGDSLLAISERFDVAMDEIIALNQLDNPDAIPVGMVLVIPVPPSEEAGTFPIIATATPTHTPLPVPTLDVTASPEDFGDPDLQIVIVIGAGDLEEERVVLRQVGEAQVSLLGWQIAAPDGETYTFPQLVLFKDGAVTLFSKAGVNNVAELYWGLDAPLWASGDVVSLRNPDGDIVAAYQVP